MIKNLPANAGTAGDLDSIPGLGSSPGRGNGNLLQYSCLENPMDRGAWQGTVYVVSKSWTRLSKEQRVTKINKKEEERGVLEGAEQLIRKKMDVKICTLGRKMPLARMGGSKKVKTRRFLRKSMLEARL